jgi:hypothetical protein
MFDNSIVGTNKMALSANTMGNGNGGKTLHDLDVRGIAAP